MALALNNQQRLICNKTQTKYVNFLNMFTEHELKLEMFVIELRLVIYIDY